MDRDSPKTNAKDPSDRIKDSAQQIWLAGLGAFAKMQEEGSKAFEALVKDGTGVQKKTQQAAEETLAQAQARMAGLASEFGAKAAGGWGKLENIFEARVARALEELGMPSAADLAALQARVAALEAQVQQLQQAQQQPPPAPAAAKTGAARKKPAASASGSRGKAAAPASKPSRRTRTDRPA